MGRAFLLPLFSALLGWGVPCSGLETFPVGAFLVSFEAPDHLSVAHSTSPQRVLWQTIPGTPFLTSAIGDDKFSPGNGHFKVEQNNQEFCSTQTAKVSSTSDAVVIEGELSGSPGGKCALPYRFELREVSANQLGFEASISDPSGAGYDRIFLTYHTPEDEEVFGLGEQFSFFRSKGEKIPLMTREQGVGRGLQPITFMLNREGKFAGGDRYTSYFGIPHYITSHNRSLFLENSEFMIVDLLKRDRIVFEVASRQIKGRILKGDSPLELIEEYTAYSGRMRPLPYWANRGAIVGMQGGEQKVYSILAELEKRNTSIGGFWNQDWCGNRIQYVGDDIQKRLWWNWEPDRQVYPNWEQLVQNLRAKDIRMLIYINTFLADVTNKTSYERNMFEEALAQGYFAKNPDGSPLLIESGPGIEAGLIDLTNPELFKWMKQIIKENMLGTGASGWMADFGEYLPYDAVLHDGDARSYKSLYPQEWARLNQEAVEEMGLEDDIVYFMRAGFSKSPQYTSLFWAGDQLPTWDIFDGIKSVVVSMLTSGLSGFGLQHSDIGGFSTAANNPPLPSYVRSRELFFRWSELAAFTSCFRTHEGSQPEKNVQFYTDDETYEFFAYCSNMFASLAPYRMELMEELRAKGYPVARHMFLHYPSDPNVLDIVYSQYLLGPDVLVAPVLDEGAREVKVYLPEGGWYHIWSEEILVAGPEGLTVTLPAPLRQPAVLISQVAIKRESLRGLIEFAKAHRLSHG